MRPPKVSVVIPALNEERNIPYVFARIPENAHEVILVDGRSIDRTVEWLESSGRTCVSWLRQGKARETR